MSENQTPQEEEKVPKHKDKLVALDSLSLGISMAVAVVLGVGIGLLLKDWTGKTWTLWIGVVLGIAAAVNNVYKAYKRAQKQYEGMENDPRYAHRAKYGDRTKDNDD
ncbi:MAG: AtpZ/AtpI family protein [Arcobacteraceae bacterium]